MFWTPRKRQANIEARHPRLCCGVQALQDRNLILAATLAEKTAAIALELVIR